MSETRITLRGLDDAVKQMQRIERGARAMGQYTAWIVSRLPYAYGIEYGRHRVSGKLARRAGGARYMRRAVDTVMAGADTDLSAGLSKVTAPGRWVLKRLALWGRRLARANAPRGERNVVKSHNYRLRRSIRAEVRKRA